MQKKLSLREAREKLGVTQQELADMLGITRTYVGLVENGIKPFSEKLERKLLKVTSTGTINVSGTTVNGSIIGHGGTVGTPPQADADFQEETRKRLSNLERLVVDLMARGNNG